LNSFRGKRDSSAHKSFLLTGTGGTRSSNASSKLSAIKKSISANSLLTLADTTNFSDFK
jgi:hypothetical protein